MEIIKYELQRTDYKHSKIRRIKEIQFKKSLDQWMKTKTICPLRNPPEDANLANLDEQNQSHHNEDIPRTITKEKPSEPPDQRAKRKEITSEEKNKGNRVQALSPQKRKAHVNNGRAALEKNQGRQQSSISSRPASWWPAWPAARWSWSHAQTWSC